MRSLRFTHPVEVTRELPAVLEPLRKLAYNLRWTWHQSTKDIFAETDSNLWEEVERNPIELINQLSKSRIETLLADKLYLTKLELAEKNLNEYLNDTTWFQNKFSSAEQSTRIAYFCAEFGIHECLKIYSGGLGILAGDHLKAASDLGIPLIGVGLLYNRGYFRQFLNPDGWQTERYPQYDFHRLPIKLVRDGENNPITVNVDFPDRKVTCQIWKAQVGRVELYLLDSNILENESSDQSITDTLYGGDEEMRIRQEIILGIGGFRALQKLGLPPTVCHMNEGHAAFLSLERIRQFMQDHNCDLRTARQCVVSGNVFTTHTPVPAGFDIFQKPLLAKYISKAVQDLGMDFEQFQRLGRIQKDSQTETFNMAVLAMENANHINGVSKLHASVSREMFADRWPEYPLVEVPIEAITNGIHTATFLSKRMENLLNKHWGRDWTKDIANRDQWQRIHEIPDQELWQTREDLRGDFVRFCRRYLKSRLEKNSTGPVNIKQAGNILDPRILTIGFARRFATYKRATLLFRDKERLKSMLFHSERPVQFVFAGKAHPRDDGGKHLIQDIIQFIKNESAESRIVFLEDYDMNIARHLVQGVDVWLNNPRRPMEASGTSGMKVLANGGLNCSILDGWWAEGYQRGLGWAIGNDESLDDEGHQDWLDSNALYDLIENEIAPTFYHRPDDGLPSGWIQMMKDSMAELCPTFSTARMVREYTARFYMPSTRSYNNLVQDNLDRAKKALEWRDRIIESWSQVRVTHVQDSSEQSLHTHQKLKIHAQVDLGSLSAEDVRVQVLVGRVTTNRELEDLDLYDLSLTGNQGNLHVFEGEAEFGTPGSKGYIVRVIPYHPDVKIASELSLVTWEPDTH